MKKQKDSSRTVERTSFFQSKKRLSLQSFQLKKKRETEKGFELKSEVERKKCLFLQDRFYKSKQNEKSKQKKNNL